MSFELYLLEPPYERLTALSVGADPGRARALAPGSIIACRPSHDADWPILAPALDDLRRSYPTAALAVWTHLLTSARRHRILPRALAAGISAHIDRSAPDMKAIRAQLTDPRFTRLVRGHGFKPEASIPMCEACESC